VRAAHEIHTGLIAALFAYLCAKAVYVGAGGSNGQRELGGERNGASRTARSSTV
jgi:hypothetical protein